METRKVEVASGQSKAEKEPRAVLVHFLPFFSSVKGTRGVNIGYCITALKKNVMGISFLSLFCDIILMGVPKTGDTLSSH